MFHPAFFFSSKIFLSFIESQNLTNKKVLDLGTGSGILALRAAQLGANVIASDISEVAIQNVKINAEINKIKIKVVQSDLFDNMASHTFDFVLINPPYFAKDPKSEEDYAWFCGSEFQYYSKLFKQLPKFIDTRSNVFMILSNNCDLKRIMSSAVEHDVVFNKVLQKVYLFEQFFIFDLKCK